MGERGIEWEDQIIRKEVSENGGEDCRDDDKMRENFVNEVARGLDINNVLILSRRYSATRADVNVLAEIVAVVLAYIPEKSPRVARTLRTSPLRISGCLSGDQVLFS